MPRHPSKAKRSTSKGSAMSRVRAAHDKHDRIAAGKKMRRAADNVVAARKAQDEYGGDGRSVHTAERNYVSARSAYHSAGGRKGRKGPAKELRRAAGADRPTTWLGAGWGF